MEYRERIAIIDTNFFLIPHQFGLDIISELNKLLDDYGVLTTSSAIVRELNEIGKGKGKTGVAARFALKIIETNKIKIVEAEGNADAWIINYAKENNAIVCTNDINLKRKLKETRIKIISLKSKSKIGFV